MLSSGPISDRFANAFSRGLFAYASFQLIWAAQVVHKLVAQYTTVGKEHRQRVHDLYMGLRPVEAEFRRFLKGKVKGRKTFFAIAALRRSRK